MARIGVSAREELRRGNPTGDEGRGVHPVPYYTIGFGLHRPLMYRLLQQVSRLCCSTYFDLEIRGPRRKI